MKITGEKALALWGVFNRLGGERTNVKFHYTIQKNKRLLETEVKSMQEAGAPPTEERYNTFEKSRQDLCKLYAIKDEKGLPTVNEKTKNFVIAEETQTEFEEKMNALREEYKDIIEMIIKREKDFIDLLRQEVEIDFVLIPLSIMPETLVGNDVELLYDMIIEDK